MFEYIAAGRPIITTGLKPIKEFLVDGRNSLIMVAEISECLREKTGRLLRDPDLRNRLSENLKWKVAAYTWERRAQTIVSFVGCWKEG